MDKKNINCSQYLVFPELKRYLEKIRLSSYLIPVFNTLNEFWH